MKKFIIILYLFSLVSCLKSYDLNIKQPDILSIYAPMDTEEEIHYIDLCVSTSNSLKILDRKATVKYSINNGQEIKADYIKSSEWGKDTYIFQRYGFSADFKEGDKVKISASFNKFYAEAEAIVPKKAQIKEVSYAITPQTPLPYNIYKTTLIINDIKGEDTYFKALNGDYNYILKNKETNESVFSKIFSEEVKFYTKSMIFEDSGFELPSDLTGELGLPNSIFNSSFIFSDKLFKNKEYTLPFEEFIQSHHLTYPDNQKDFDYLDGEMIFKIGTITKDYYLYQCSVHAFLGSSGLFTEPVAIKNNIKGGIGYFGIMNIASLRLPLKGVKLKKNSLHHQK